MHNYKCVHLSYPRKAEVYYNFAKYCYILTGVFTTLSYMRKDLRIHVIHLRVLKFSLNNNNNN